MTWLKHVAAFLFLLAIPGTAFAQAKPVVAVREITDLANTGQEAAFTAMVQSAVAQTNKFRVMERDFKELQQEQQEARSGKITSQTSGRSGGFEGADFLIYGTITSASAGRQGDGGASVGRGFAEKMLGFSLGGKGCSKATATLAVDVKVVDGASGEIRFAKSLTQTSTTATSCSGEESLDVTNLLRSVADQIATGLVTTIYPIKIATVQSDGTFVLNYGEAALAPGTIMTVYGPSEQIPDPSGGGMITIDGTKLGYIQVVEVATRFSKAKGLSEFGVMPPIGSVVREASADESAQFSSKRRR